MPHKSPVRFRTTKLPNLAITLSSLFSIIFTRTGSIDIKAGKKVTARMNEIITPIDTKLPRCLKGGTSEKFMVKKPIAVVILARKTGCRLTRRLSINAFSLLDPCCISCIKVTRTWTELAIATVRMIIGAEAEGGVMGNIHPSPLPQRLKSILSTQFRMC